MRRVGRPTGSHEKGTWRALPRPRTGVGHGMKACSVCDEPLPSEAVVCPACRSPISRIAWRRLVSSRYMVALFLIVLALSLLIWRNLPALREHARWERRARALQEMRVLGDRLRTYMLEHDYEYPESLAPVLEPRRRKPDSTKPVLGPPRSSDLFELIEIPALDPWGHPWRYQKPASSRQWAGVRSDGEDGVQGTSDDL